MINKPIEKPKILSDKAITEAINRVYPSRTRTHQVNVADKAIAQKALDECYKEMLGQFKEMVHLADELCAYMLVVQEEVEKRQIVIPKVWSKPIDAKYIRGLMEKAKEWQALQSQLEER